MILASWTRPKRGGSRACARWRSACKSAWTSWWRMRMWGFWRGGWWVRGVSWRRVWRRGVAKVGEGVGRADCREGSGVDYQEIGGGCELRLSVEVVDVHRG